MPELIRRLAIGFAAACAAQLALVPALRTTGQDVPPSFFLANFVAILVLQWGAALALGKVGRERAWAALVFLLPIAFAAYPLAERYALGAGHGRLLGAGLLAAVAAVIWAIWARFGPRPGAPVVSAMLGSAVGSAALYFIYEYFQGSQTPLRPLAVLAGFGLVSFVVALFVGKLPIPRMPAPVAIAVGALLGVIAAFGGPLDIGPTVSPPKALTANAERPPVVLIVLDTVRADRLARYGGPRNTMPLLEQFASDEAVTFERAVANSPWTLPTHASLFTGLVPPRHGAHSPFQDDANPPASFYPLATGKATLAQRLRDAGYWTLGVVANSGPLSSYFGLDRGFHFYRAEVPAAFVMKRYTPWRLGGDASWPLEALDALPPFKRPAFFGKGLWVRDAEDISDEAIGLVDRAGDRPFFLFVNYIDAHDPYTPYEAFFEGESIEPPTERLRGDWKEVAKAVLSGQQPLSEVESAYLLDVYDSELGFLDAHLARLLDRLRAHPAWDDMMVIVTSDHGEAFGEHGLIAHGLNLYDEVVHVPLFIKPGAGAVAAHPPGSSVSSLVESVDVCPTVLSHAGVKVPSNLDGLVWGEGRSEARSWLYWPQLAAQIDRRRFDRELRSLRRGDWKLIESTRHESELYELASDRAERVNRLSDSPEVAESLRSALGPGQDEATRARRARGRSR